MLFSSTRSDEIELPARNLSPEIQLPAGDLSLAVLTHKPATGETVNPNSPLVKIPEAWDRCILLFFPDPENKVFPAKVIPVNASKPDFRLGETLIYNVTAASVSARFADRAYPIDPGKSAVIAPPIAGSGSYPVAIVHSARGNPTHRRLSLVLAARSRGTPDSLRHSHTRPEHSACLGYFGS